MQVFVSGIGYGGGNSYVQGRMMLLHSPLMIRSMTGFGRAEATDPGKRLSVEVRSLNSKGLDLALRTPGNYREKEVELRRLFGERIVRGKADVVISVETQQVDMRTTFDADLAKAYYGQLRALTNGIDPQANTDLMGFVLRMPEVARTAREEVDEQEWRSMVQVIDRAIGAFDDFRRAEGARLKEDLRARVRHIMGLLAEVDPLDANRRDRVRERITARLNELAVEVDKDRFEQEMIYYLEKLDVNEEKVRLRTHCAYFEETMDAEQDQGRKLGFIAQEMGREINTLGAKANDAAIQKLVVRMKDELERIKEQAMNVL